MISQTAEYALRAVVYLSMQASGTGTSEQIAETTMVPPGYLSKILQKLTREGLICSQRGLGGGYALARPSDQISILDVVNAVDPIERLVTCPLGIESHGAKLCPLHQRISEATASVESAFDAISLCELLRESESALCTSTPLKPQKGGRS